MVSTTGIIIRQGTAFVPVTAQTEMGVYIDYEPVFVTELTVEALTATLEQVTAIGHPQVPHPSREEWRRWRSPVLKAAKVRSWKQMADGGASYSIEWTEDEIVLRISHPTDPAKWRNAPVVTRKFPKGTSLPTLVEAVLEDAKLHPELLDEGGDR